jgi:predicted DNA binding CopG/RHH family protein
VRDSGERERNDMNRKTGIYKDAPKDTDNSIVTGKRVIDFLPPPEKLAKKAPKVKITISLSSNSVDFFKKSAKKNKVKYQTMINEILDQYAQKYS